MQPPFPVSQMEPYILKKVLLPTQQSSFIHNLIVSYNKKLSDGNEQFQKQFSQKQQKLQRHKQQLKLLPQMKADPQLMNKILQEIELKDYEKQYLSVLTQSQKKHIKLLSKKGEKSMKNNSVDKENYNKTFHVTRRKNNKDFSVDNGNKTTQRDQSLMNVTQGNKKFRSSVIKSSSFSAIKRAKTPFSTKTNINIESIRNSQDVALPQQGLINYFNLKDNKLSEALYGKRPQSKGAGMKRQQGIIKRKNISSLSPEWMREYAQKQKIIDKKNVVLKNEMRDDMKIRFQDDDQQQGIKINKVIAGKQLEKNAKKEQQRISIGQQQQSTRRVMLNQGEHQSKRSYQTKMQQMAQIIQQSSKRQNKQQSNPYHISNFIKQLNSYHINSSKSTHNLGKLGKSRRRLIVQKSGE